MYIEVILLNRVILGLAMQNQLARKWCAAGIKSGDMVLLHSNITRTMRYCRRAEKTFSVQQLLQSFLQAIGPNGTLILPLFNFDFTKGVPFDYKETPSQMGRLTEVARAYPGAVRSGHPIYSFAGIGHQAPVLSQINNYSGYGKDSVFSLLHQQNGKIAILDLEDQNSMTFYHYVEEMHDVDYRYHKAFSGEYIDAQGHHSERKYGLFVRDLEQGVHTDVNRMGALLWRDGYYCGEQPGKNCGLRTVAAAVVYDKVADVIQSGRAIDFLYSIKKGVTK